MPFTPPRFTPRNLILHISHINAAQSSAPKPPIIVEITKQKRMIVVDRYRKWASFRESAGTQSLST